MAIKVSGTTVIDDSRALTNIASVDATTVASLSAAGVGGASSINGLSDAFSDGTSIAFGPDALAVDRNRNLDNSTTNNIAIGQNSLASSTSGNQNVCIGYNTGGTGTTLGTNVFIGTQSGRLSNGSANVCVGPYTGYSLSGFKEANTFIGSQAGFMSDSDGNTAVGKSAMILATSAGEVTAIGKNALQDLTTGSGNTALGSNAGESLTTGGNNTFIGRDAAASATTVSNCIVIGKDAAPSNNSVASNEITLGNSSITLLRCNTTNISSLSDKRDKKNVEDIGVGLDFLKTLRPVSFDWDQRDKGRVDLPDVGFIAQELLEAQKQSGVHVPNLVSTINPDKLEAAYSTLIPVLVQAIKDLSQQVDDLKNKS